MDLCPDPPIMHYFCGHIAFLSEKTGYYQYITTSFLEVDR